MELRVRLPPPVARLNDIADPIDQDICTQCALSWKIVASVWRSTIAVSLNVHGGIRFVKPAKLYMCMQIHYKHDEDGCTAPGVPHGAECALAMVPYC